MPDDPDLLHVFGKLDFSLGELTKQAKRQSDLQELARKATVPSMVRFHLTGTVPASGFLVLSSDHSGPRQGYVWTIRRLSISGVTPTTVIGGRADVFISAMGYSQVTDFSQIGMADWADQAVSLPLVGTYGDGEMQLYSPERMHIIISGGTQGQVVIGNGVATQTQESAAAQEYRV